jgi:hypothetical protein
MRYQKLIASLPFVVVAASCGGGKGETSNRRVGGAEVASVDATSAAKPEATAVPAASDPEVQRLSQLSEGDLEHEIALAFAAFTPAEVEDFERQFDKEYGQSKPASLRLLDGLTLPVPPVSG